MRIRTWRAAPAQRGQALPLALGIGVLLLAGAAALFMLGRVQVAKARAQTAADLAALSAGRRLRELLPSIAADGPVPRRDWRPALLNAARPSAEADGGRLAGLVLPDGGWPPTAVEVRVVEPGPAGTRVAATARAGLTVAAPLVVPGASAGPRGWATGGGYSGPLLYRDGRPMCPAVAAAFDRMDAAAHAAGVDLRVNSGFRSDAEQAVLFRRHPDPRWVAPPGRSRHRDATELDIDTGAGAGAWLAAHGTEFGFVERYSWEPWHWGYVSGCDGAAPSVGAGDPPPADADAALPPWVPGAYRAPVASAARAEGLAPALLAALLQAESGFDPRAVSPAGALGIAQFMPATAAGLGLRDPLDPAQAIPAAARLLAGHVRALGSVPLGLAAYNAGAGAVRRYGGVPPFRETQAYVARVLALAGGAALAAPLPGFAAGGGVELIRAGEAFV